MFSPHKHKGNCVRQQYVNLCDFGNHFTMHMYIKISLSLSYTTFTCQVYIPQYGWDGKENYPHSPGNENFAQGHMLIIDQVQE